ncbi:hypothetical protein [Psychrobacillus sp. L3]|uniref:hypothetical protein n=1 Tax=Psychrobacillus sp. L3 TaxID=3236891 RepID=UPI0036F2BB16
MLHIVHLYANEYGWTRDYILDNVYIDEHILNQEIIDDNKQQEWLMKSYISLLPNYKDDDRQKFLKSLTKEEEHKSIKENQKTDFDAIRRAKEQMKNM